MVNTISYWFDTSGQFDRNVDPHAVNEAEDQFARQQSFCCAVCNNKVTRRADAITVEGSHCHRKINPQGRHYHVCCFASAPGCDKGGDPTGFFSWFSGYAWSFAYCDKCNTQLGWYFEGSDHFFGLIDEQIRPCDQQGGSGTT